MTCQAVMINVLVDAASIISLSPNTSTPSTTAVLTGITIGLFLKFFNSPRFEKQTICSHIHKYKHICNVQVLMPTRRSNPQICKYPDFRPTPPQAYKPLTPPETTQTYAHGQLPC